MSESMDKLAEELSLRLKHLGLMMACAESCTGGLLAAAMTANPGASDVFERGIVSYSNEAKREILGVPAETLKTYGAVSGQTAAAMARGLIKCSRAEIVVSITGIAGPGGGSEEKPVGLVYIGYGMKSGALQAVEHRFEGTREEIRHQSVKAALTHLIKFLDALA